MEGVSLVPLLDDPEATLDRKAVVTTYGYRNHAVSSDRYRYIVYSDGSEELYDLETDPARMGEPRRGPGPGGRKGRVAGVASAA